MNQPLDPIRTADLLAAGARLWFVAHQDPPEMQDKIWILFEEAAQTMRALPRGGPKGAGSSWPEFLSTMTKDEIETAKRDLRNEPFAAMNEKRAQMAIHEKDVDPPARPTAAALSRFLDVMGWLKYIPARQGHKALRMKLLIALAAGVGPQGLARSPEFAPLNFRSRQAVDMFRRRSLIAIEAELRKALGNDQTAGIHVA